MRDVSSQMGVSQPATSRPKRRRLLHDQPSCSDSRIQSNLSIYKNISSVLSDLLGTENPQTDGKRKKPRYQIDTSKPCTVISNTSAYRPEVDIRDCDSSKTAYSKIQSDSDSLVRKFFTDIFENNRIANTEAMEERYEPMHCDAQVNPEIDARKILKYDTSPKASKSLIVDDSNASNLRDRMNVVVNRVFDVLGKNNTPKDVTVSDVTQEVDIMPCTSGSSNFDGKEVPPPDDLDNLISVMQNVNPRETEKITELIAVAKKVLWNTGDGAKQKETDPKCSKKK